MSLTIVIVQSKITGQWNYCPAQAVSILRPALDDKPSYLLTADQAIAAAKQDKSIPRGTKFVVQS